MSGVGKEASGVGQHTDKVAQAAQVSQTGHLVDHAGLVVIEPPSRALLNLACSLCTLEASDDGADSSVVVGVQGVQNGSRDFVGCA